MSFVIGLTNHDPRRDEGPLGNLHSVCASRMEPMKDGETIRLKCTDRLNTRGRYLFLVANTTDDYLNLAEVEVFNSKLLDKRILCYRDWNYNQVCLTKVGNIFKKSTFL